MKTVISLSFPNLVQGFSDINVDHSQVDAAYHAGDYVVIDGIEGLWKIDEVYHNLKYTEGNPNEGNRYPKLSYTLTEIVLDYVEREEDGT